MPPASLARSVLKPCAPKPYAPNSDNDHERSEVPRLVLHVLCGGEREEEGERERERERERRERGRESAEAVCT